MKKTAPLTSSLLARKGAAAPSRFDPPRFVDKDSDEDARLLASARSPFGSNQSAGKQGAAPDEASTIADVLSNRTRQLSQSEGSTISQILPIREALSRDSGPRSFKPYPAGPRPASVRSTPADAQGPGGEVTAPLRSDDRGSDDLSPAAIGAGDKVAAIGAYPEEVAVPPAPNRRPRTGRIRRQVAMVIGGAVAAAFAVVLWSAYHVGLDRGERTTQKVIQAEGVTAGSKVPDVSTPVAAPQIVGKPVPTRPAEMARAVGADAPTASRPGENLPPPAIATTDQAVPPPAPPGMAQPARKVAPPSREALNDFKESAFSSAPNSLLPGTANKGATPAVQVPRSKSALATPPEVERVAAAKLEAVAPNAGTLASAPAANDAQAQLATAKKTPVVRTAKSKFVIQLASVRSQAAAKAEWERLTKAHQEFLGALSPDVAQVEIAGRGTFYRLRADGFATKTAAVSLCDKMKSGGLTCLVVSR